jgi:hypothetical protein
MKTTKDWGKIYWIQKEKDNKVIRFIWKNIVIMSRMSKRQKTPFFWRNLLIVYLYFICTKKNHDLIDEIYVSTDDDEIKK